MLTNEAYTGVTIFNGYRYWDSKAAKTEAHPHGRHSPRPVSPEEFGESGLLNSARSSRTPGQSAASIFKRLGLLRLMRGQADRHDGQGRKFFYYGCQNYLKKGREACKGGLVSRPP